MKPPTDYVVIPLQANSLGLLDVTLTLNGIACRFHLDTGASQSCLDRAQVGQFALEESDVEYMAAGLGGSQKVSKITVEHMVIGSHPIGEFDLHVIDLSVVNVAAAQMGAEPIDGVLGSDFLRQYQAIIDYRVEELYIRFQLS